MKYLSTRKQAPVATLSEAIRNGSAPDGGLYLPETMPPAPALALDASLPLAEFAAAMLRPFFAGDRLEPELAAICAQAFNFPVPLVTPDSARPALRGFELFHGPTGAFKDFGARFLLACFDRLGDPAYPLTVLAATSGDTGGAVGCAAEGHKAVRAVILFPKGRVSPFQERQLTCWGEPVQAIEVDGDFDDCQRLVKAAFADPALSARHRLTSANSINIARLLPQAAFAAHAAVRLQSATGSAPGFAIPTGNLGHGVAVLLARAMGFPVGPVVLATNANATLADWHRTGGYQPRSSVPTMANAMDVGAPSNFERLEALAAELGAVLVELVDDAAICARLRSEYQASGYVWCPHSAIAVEAYSRLPEAQRSERPWIAAATAHPFKFADILEPVIGARIDPPPQLAAILDRPVRKVSIPATLEALAAELGAREAMAA
jgi:threonine synthase